MSNLELVPNTENVVFIDEYPHLEERIKMRRMGQLVLFREDQDQLILFPVQGEGSDERA